MGTVQHVAKTYIHWNLFETVISTFTFVILFMNQTSDYHRYSTYIMLMII